MKEINNNQVVIRVSDIRKSFRIFNDKSNTLKERILFWKRGKHTIHQVLKGINLEIRRGETVALIGQNGSGKSTLLKLLTGIMYPDEGKITIDGKVSSLLELGAGFHPDFSGRENIYNNASIFGLSKKEIDHRYDRIVAFSELEEYIDTPVRTYSSGMYMRLAFSVAINVDADILLIDEILAVGDANFQKKCMDMIRHLKKQGVTIVLVTHDMGAVERICDRAVWLVDGCLRMQGNPREIIDEYLLDMDEKSVEIAQKEKRRTETATIKQHVEPERHVDSHPPVSVEEKVEEKNEIIEIDETGERVRWGNGAILISNVEILDREQKSGGFILAGSSMVFCIHYAAYKEIDSLVFGIAVKNSNGDLCIGTNSDLRHIVLKKPSIGEKGTIAIKFDHFDLAKGNYTLDVAAHSLEGLPYDYQQARYSFMVSNPYSDVGIYAPRMSFELKIEE